MSRRLQVFISESLEARIRHAAQRSRVPASEWVRRTVEKALAKSDALAKFEEIDAPAEDNERILAEIEVGRRRVSSFGEGAKPVRESWESFFKDESFVLPQDFDTVDDPPRR